MAGINRQILGEVTQGSAKKGSLESAINSAFSPSAIAKAKPKKQECKKK